MSPQPYNAKSIFLEAVEKYASDQWPGYLKQACGDDLALREHVEALLRAHGESNRMLDGDGLVATIDAPPIAEQPGMTIGRYKLVHEIGQGGMGVVYMAVQKEPVKRKVALKIIKPGMDTREVVTRFEAERQALALMDHQCIATVLDGGSTESGRPYFVMELVEGTPITEYADACRNTTRQRLVLFVQVCQAVQHAHQKGVIHRDLKPSNILVTNCDDKAVPKVIDFGIAKAVHQQLTDQSFYTHVSQMVGTPLYISPEQAQRTDQDVDTRTDVYSLGVLLYELLTGTTPFDKARLESSGLDEFKRIIREEEPPRPSARLSTLDAALDTVVENHQTDLRTLTQELNGELDWIVMKSLEKDRTRRYESASELAKDVQRYLDDEAVEACPPTVTYRLKKFARRHKAQLATVASIAVVLVIASVVSSCLAAWALQAERVARTNFVQAKKDRAEALDARALAKRQEELAKQQEQLAKQQRDAAEYDLYVSDVRLAKYDWMAGLRGRFRDTLYSHLPAPGRPDLRGWEWYYYFSRCHRDRFTFPLQRQTAIAWSEDGGSLATVDQVGLVNVWDLSNGQLKISLKGCPGAITSISWSPDGKRLAAGGDRKIVWVWDLASGNKIQSFRGHSASVHCIDWNPDGVRIASGGADGTIHVWDSHTGEGSSSWVGRSGPLQCLDWHPDGNQILSVAGLTGKCTAKIWDTVSGSEVGSWSTGYGTSAAFSPDGSRIAWVRSDGTRVKDLKTLKDVSSFPQTGADRAVWSPNGQRLASSSDLASGIKIWDADSGAEISSMRNHTSVASVQSVAWRDTGLLLAGYDDGAVKVWDTTSMREALTLSTPDRYALCVAFSPDGRRLLAGARFGLLKMWDVESGEETLTVRSGNDWINSIAWGPDGNRFAAKVGEGVMICDADNGKRMLPLLKCTGNPVSLAWSPVSSILAVKYSRRQLGVVQEGVHLWDASTGREVAASRYTDMNTGQAACAWSPEGNRLAEAGSLLRVWDSALRNEAHVESDGVAKSLDWSPDSQYLAVGFADGSIKIYDTTAWLPIRDLVGHSGIVRSVDWHPHMARLASGAQDGTVRIWDTSTGRELCGFETHTDVVNGVAWSPDGLRLASASYDCTVRIWDTSVADRFLKKRGDLREKAYGFVQAHQYQEAIDLLQQLHTIYSQDRMLAEQLVRTKWLRASQLMQEGASEEAIAIYKQASAEMPDLPDYRLRMPAILFDAGEQREAIGMLEALVAEFPETREYRDELAFLHERAVIHLCQSGRFGEATAILLKLVDDFPARPDFRAELAYQMVKAGRLEQTMAELEKTADALARWPDYRPQLARRLAGCSEWGPAITAYHRIIADFPDEPDYRSELADCLMGAGQYEEAIDVLQKLVTDFPTVVKYRERMANGHYQQGLATQNQGRLGEAEAAFAQAVTLEGNLATDFPGATDYVLRLARYYTNIIQVQRARDQHEDAKQTYQQAWDIIDAVAVSPEAIVGSRRNLKSVYRSLYKVAETKSRTPRNVRPSAEARVAGGPVVLETGSFEHDDSQIRHLATRWQVRSADKTYSSPVVDRVSKTDLQRLAIPSGTLFPRTTYHWRVAYIASDQTLSEYSSETSFVTGDMEMDVIPFDLEPSFNGDVVLNAGDHENDTLDDEDGRLLEEGFDGVQSDNRQVHGLPRDRRVGAHVLGDYDAPNAVQLKGGNDVSVRISVPRGRYSQIRFLVTGGGGHCRVPVSFHYADSSTENRFLPCNDWWDAEPPGGPLGSLYPGATPILNNLSRWYGGRCENGVSYALFEVIIVPDPDKELDSFVLEAKDTLFGGWSTRVDYSCFNLLGATGIRVVP